MADFGKRLASLRKEQKLSQTELAKQLDTSISVISRYERGEMIPSIKTAKKLAEVLGTTVGYLLGEGEQGEQELFKDPDMMKRFKNVALLKGKSKEHVLFTIDAMLRDIKLRELANS